jgi:hypothetical protein
VIAHRPALAGAFVALANAEGFLPDSDGGARLGVGGAVVVRISRAAQGGKGPRLSTRLQGFEPPPHCAFGLLRTGPHALERMAALYPQAPIALDDPGVAAGLRPLFGHRLTLVQRVFPEALEGDIEALSSPIVMTQNGARFSITPTPALTAIDMDTAHGSSERRDKASAQLAINRAMLPDLARQIRLRNLSGAILVDFAGLSSKRRSLLRGDLETALHPDPLRPQLLGFTALGLAEIVRPRIHPPLHELSVGPHAAGLAALRQLAADFGPGATLHAAPAVISALQADRQALDSVANRIGRPPALRSDPALSGCRWLILR